MGEAKLVENVVKINFHVTVAVVILNDRIRVVIVVHWLFFEKFLKKNFNALNLIQMLISVSNANKKI